MFSEEDSGNKGDIRAAPSSDDSSGVTPPVRGGNEALAKKGNVRRQEGSSIELPDIEKSCMYLVEEEKSEKSYQLFEKALEDGLPGLCATRVYPEILKQRHNLNSCVMLWLSNAGKEDSIRPRDLERLSLLLEQFVTTRKGVVLIDGIEYLITNNDFVTVLRLVQSLRDQIAMNLAIMIISLNPSTLGFQELNLLEREMDTVLRMCSQTEQGQQDFHSR